LQQSSAPPESLTGIVERVTFFNEENGFAVLKVKSRAHREEVTVVGIVPAVSPGEFLTAEGRWVQDRQFGMQFKAELLKSTPPSTREGIEKYLGSGLVKGIGPVYARKLVAKFGEQIFDIIENYSIRLEEVGGIGTERRRRIKDAWAEQKVIRHIMVFLHSNGVSTSRAVRIYKTYGDGAVEEIRADPYKLARDIPGIGFKTADQIAQKLGVPHDSVLRACAGLEHVLAEATGQGHCGLPLPWLAEQTSELLGIPGQIVTTALQRSFNDSILVRDTIDGETFAFLPALKKAEELIAARLRQLSSGPPAYPEIHFERAVDWCQRKTGYALAPSQREALRIALKSRVLVVTGGPGVGKTTLINSLLRILRARKVVCVLCAPTGRAAKRLSEATGSEARTIHRLLEVDPARGGFQRNERRPLACDLLVVDESSMLDVPLMSSLLRALPPHAALVLVGDVDQLPSVGPGMVLLDMIESRRFPVVRLTEVFRQAAHSQIVTNAHLINQGVVPELETQTENSDFYFVERDEPERILETLVRVIRERIPAKFHLDPANDVQVLTPMHRGLLGVRELNARLQAELNPPGAGGDVVEKFGVQFRTGDKVLQTENDYDKQVFNGDIGRVMAINPIEQEVTIRFDRREVVYDFAELDEIALAYAITVHKAQGSEFPAVVLPVCTQHYLLLQRNLLYTGITRGKKLVVVVGQRKALALAVHNNKTQHRYSGLLARLRGE
jgi:exodeoxyribonuclease V alpha subunit